MDITESDVYNLVRDHSDDQWIADGVFMLGHRFETDQVKTNLEIRYADTSRFFQFVDTIEEYLGVTVETKDNYIELTQSDETKRYHRVSAGEGGDNLKKLFQHAHSETIYERNPEALRDELRTRRELIRQVAAIIRSRARSDSIQNVDQTFIWEVNRMLTGDQYQRRSKRYVLYRLVRTGVIAIDGSSNIYPHPYLLGDEVGSVLPEISIGTPE